MLMQLLGGLAVVGSAAAIGFYYAAREGFRVQELTEFKKALVILASEIEYMRTPLPLAAENIGKRAEGWVGKLFTQFGELLKTGDGETAYRLWTEAIKNVKGIAFLTEEDWTVLDGFGKTLGYLDKQMQCNAIHHASAYIDEKTASLQTQAAQNKKMYRSLGVIGGLLIAVMLW